MSVFEFYTNMEVYTSIGTVSVKRVIVKIQPNPLRSVYTAKYTAPTA